MTDPPAVDQKAVDQIHDKENCVQLSEALPKTMCTVDRVNADEHIGQIAWNTADLKEFAVSFDSFVGGQAELHAAVLHLRFVQVHHADRTVSDADHADQHQKRAQPDALQE